MRKQLIDQGAHALAAFVIVLCALFVVAPLGQALAGALIGLTRELTEEGRSVTREAFRRVIVSPESRLDVAFWAVGGMIAGILAANLGSGVQT